MRKVFLAVALAAPLFASAQNLVVNGNFEANNVGSGYLYGTQIYTPNGLPAAPWIFTGYSGVAASGAGGFGGDATSVGSNAFAFLQGYSGVDSSVSQSFAGASGTYTIAFDLAQRTNQSQTAQSVNVYFDNTLVTATALQPADGGGWSHYSVTGYAATAGQQTLVFKSMYSGGDSTAFVTNISATVAAVPEPETYALLLAGLGLIGAAVKRRKAKQA